jgi:hypothetical protein
MTFVCPELSVTASLSAIRKARLRSKELPNFSKMPVGSKPFFKQWHIHAVDVARILFVSYTEARALMSALRCFYGRSKRAAITVEEFCAFTRIGKSYVRMQLVSRVVERELGRQGGGVR